MDEFNKQDPFLEAQVDLGTAYKWKQFLVENFTHVEPIEILLNPDEKSSEKAVVHYVPIIESVKNMLEDLSFNSVVENNVRGQNKDYLEDIKDGYYYKNNEFFKENPSAYTMLLYSDAIELVNPLGAAKTKYKVIQIFFTLCDVPKHLRSQIDNIQLVAVFKEKLIKTFGFAKIYQQLVKDLRKLEEGIIVNNPVRRIVKCGLILHPADNLEAHGVGGFSRSFNAGDICRFCHIKYNDLQINVHNYGSQTYKAWTVEEYDQSVNVIENMEDDVSVNMIGDDGYSNEASEEESECSITSESESEDDIELYGIKHKCPLNDLRAFHAVYGFPPGIEHVEHEVFIL